MTNDVIHIYCYLIEIYIDWSIPIAINKEKIKSNNKKNHYLFFTTKGWLPTLFYFFLKTNFLSSFLPSFHPYLNHNNYNLLKFYQFFFFYQFYLLYIYSSKLNHYLPLTYYISHHPILIVPFLKKRIKPFVHTYFHSLIDKRGRREKKGFGFVDDCKETRVKAN